MEYVSVLRWLFFYGKALQGISEQVSNVNTHNYNLDERSLSSLTIRPRVYVVIPPPIYGDFPVEVFEMSAAVINQYLPSHLPVLAKENGAMVINAFKDMGGSSSSHKPSTIPIYTVCIRLYR